MALRILKLAITAATEVTTNPEVTRLFHVPDVQVTEGAYTIQVGDFETDDGDTATALPELLTDNSYYNVYINGVLQMAGISTYTPGEAGEGQLEITVGEEETIEENTPIVLEITNFDPASSTNIVT